MTKLLIAGGRVVDPSCGRDGVTDVLVEDGRIAAVAAGLPGDGAEVLDARGLVVTPGFVDLHAHLREPGFEYKGTVEAETLAALRGGFTTVCAMPNTNPPHDTRATVEFVLDQARRAGHARVFPIGAVTKGRAGKELAEMAELADAGCVACSDDGSPVADAALMRRAMEYAAGLGLPIIEHCDEPALSGGGVMHEGLVSSRLGLKGQPAEAEVAAVDRNIELAALTGCHLHVAHVSTAGAVAAVRRAKERGLRVSAEVTPSHLFLTEDAVMAPAYNADAKVNPPLRTEEDRRALIAGLVDGTIDVIATDHAPHAWTEKECEFDRAAFGIACLETAAGSLLTQVAAGELPLERVIEALTAAPAQLLCLDQRAPGTGSIQEGTDAALAIIDPEEEWLVDSSEFASLGANTPLAGRRLRGRVVATVLGGRVLRTVPAGAGEAG